MSNMSLNCICPACHDGHIVRCKIIKLEKIIFLCRECEIFWLLEEEIGNFTFMYLNDFLLDQNLTTSIDEIVFLEN